MRLAGELFVILLGVVGFGALGTGLALAAGVLIGPAFALLVGFLYVWLASWAFVRATDW